MGQYNAEGETTRSKGTRSTPEDVSGIKVLDRAVLIMEAIATKPRSLGELSEATGLPRATTHRLATALEAHRLLWRTSSNQWAIGPRAEQLAGLQQDRLLDVTEHIMSTVLDDTKESVQLYRQTGLQRICVASMEPKTGLQNTVPVGTRMTLRAGSAAKVFVAFGDETLREAVLPQAPFSTEELSGVVSKGWAESISEREPGLASVSVPVFFEDKLIAALSISGPAERLGDTPGKRFGPTLVSASEAITQAML